MTSTTTKPQGQSAARQHGRMSGYPAPRQLATMTDLKPNEVQAVTEAINPLIADAFALYTKTKNFHWHLSGSHFRDLHLLFDDQADSVLTSIDIMAERVRRVGGTTLRSITHVSQLQTIQDDNDDFVSAGQMVQRLMQDNQHIAAQIRAAIAVCDDNRDSPTSNLLQEILDETERRKWFLFEIAQGMNNMD